jgi:PhzF family phenazine biosynthesis protein
MGLPLFQVDAFTDRAFAGNPAAVCLLDAPRDDAFLCAVAAEMNLSETAFLLREGDGQRLRWFTPAAEVALCGHATLATAHVLWEQGILAPDEPARFLSRSGPLGATRRGDLIELDFPAKAATPAEAPAGLLAALGVRAREVHRNVFDYLVLLDDEAAVRAAAPDFAALRRVDARGVIVTSPSADPAFDIVSRFFAPAVGIDEDPVTGSAHCALAPFWAARLGRSELRAFQASRRGGVLDLRVAGDRVALAGRAVTVLRGDLVV